MDNIGHYNIHTISDSDDSVIMINDHRTNDSSHNDNLSSPEPEFFRKVLQRVRQQKRKSLSSERTVHETDTYLAREDVHADDNRNTDLQIEDLGPNFREPLKRKKSLSPELTQNKKDKICLTLKDVYTNDDQNYCFLIEDPKPCISQSKTLKHIDSYVNNQIMQESDPILTSMNNKETIEPIEPKRKKRLTKEEVEKRKKEEKAKKDAKKNLAEELKRLNPKECLKYITVHIDINLQNRDFSEQILTEIRSSDASYKIESNSIIPHSVSWSRQMSNDVNKNENFMLIIWDFDYVKNLVTSDQLIEEINRLKLYQTQLSIIIYSTADQLKKAKSKKKGQFSMSEMLNSLEQMMLSCHVSFRFIENKNDIGMTIMYFTKAIAQKPYKLNKYKEEQDGCDWYASGHTKSCVVVDKNGNGLTQLWRQMLSQFPLCALETSEAIASVYATPIALYEAYNKCCSRLEGETLLQDIPVRRGFGPLVSNRRIGPELSKKLYKFFTDNTGYTTLSQE